MWSLPGINKVTRDWWERRTRFELFVSDAVIEELPEATETLRDGDWIS